MIAVNKVMIYNNPFIGKREYVLVQFEDNGWYQYSYCDKKGKLTGGFGSSPKKYFKKDENKSKETAR